MVYVHEGYSFLGGEGFNGRPRARKRVPGFLIDRREVTVGEYREFLRSLPPAEAERLAPRYSEKALRAMRPDIEGRPVELDDLPADLPAGGTTHDGAEAYALRAGKRLPSEDEWERAARGADGRPYPWGFQAPAPAGQKGAFAPANVLSPLGRSSVAGEFPLDRSPFGVLDLGGNQMEHVGEWFVAGEYWVRRSGSWAISPGNATAWFRDSIAPADTRDYMGFRCAKDLPAE